MLSQIKKITETRSFGWGRIRKIVLVIAGCLIVYLVYNYYYTSKGYLYIDSAPSGANIRINEKQLAEVTPSLVGPLRPGKHEILLQLPSYETWYTEIKVPRNDTLWLTPELIVRPGSFSSLDILSTPGDASIFIDDILQQATTPAVLTRIKPGPHHIQIQKQGFTSIDTILFLRPRSEKLEFMLQRSAGSLIINSTPSQANIWFDGKLLSSKTPHQVDNIDIGLYTVELGRNGYKKSKKTVNIQTDQTASLNFKLDKLKASKGFGKILITAAIVTQNDRERTSFPAIFIDDEIRGQAPSTLSLPVGEYTIEARLSGFSSLQKTVTILANRTIHHKFEFSKNN
ncbi:MAG: PEGA domain-containing protein [Calditrichaeota bacterium]|nr:MAG: PEGA domain-containing protein [Calditrichota bacterium]